MPQHESECAGKEIEFSWQPCSRCQSKLGGNRHEWFKGSELLGHVCLDCFNEIECGATPSEKEVTECTH
ncbi:hypothetical protein KAR91_66830 [Candidatus Pacearchaeota archaeon]|nr:hypothetical protein [Candidatus Pacearchaeota archaeon]